MCDKILKRKAQLTDVELSEYWGIKVNTLRKWRSKGIGPVYLKIGGHVVYKRKDITKYENSRKFLSPGEHIIENKGKKNEK